LGLRTKVQDSSEWSAVGEARLRYSLGHWFPTRGATSGVNLEATRAQQGNTQQFDQILSETRRD